MPLPMFDRAPEGPGAPAPRRTHRRFDRAARLFSEPGLHRLMDARVLVIGMGGVGSFAAESLARSAVGELVLIDFDDVCVTNANRQLHALRGNIGKAKVEVMAERLRRVNPQAAITPVARFYEAAASDALLDGRVDFVVDAIDNLTAKAHLVATCVARGLPIVSSMGAAARMDPTAIRVTDLSETQRDPFAKALRKILRREHGIDARRGRPIGVPAVYSEELPREPSALSYDEGRGFVCVCPNKDNGMHTCDHRSRIDGSASFVTGAFGLAAASVVVRRLVDG
ncbi:MAG TPA: tRNA threonylcarbamoyladenosine dehydratase [Sandaracinaceae bacterium LLY-WYZ-13_1]|nr:tRNA threonylcarbamoyladenosine dehydratase [Sandaracinaceae bacterium LLY-WYZ-13_1]